MNDQEDQPGFRAAEMRRAFDESFAVARRPPGAANEDLLLVRIGDRRYGIRMVEIRGLHEGRKITPLPLTPLPLMGIAGIRGELVPVYTLAGVLDAGEEIGECRWLVTCGEPRAELGLAFNGFEGSLRIPTSDLYRPEHREGLPNHTHSIARLPSESCYVVGIGSICAALSNGADASPMATPPHASGDE